MRGAGYETKHCSEFNVRTPGPRSINTFTSQQWYHTHGDEREDTQQCLETGILTYINFVCLFVYGSQSGRLGQEMHSKSLKNLFHVSSINVKV